MSYVIFDLECTCWPKDDPKRMFHETIEIGAVLLDNDLNIISEFQQFVRPTYNQTLSDYCKDLTSITQEQVNAELTFAGAMQHWEQWRRDNAHCLIQNITFVSWGAFDRKQIADDCVRNSYPSPINYHVNLKEEFSKFLRVKKRFGLAKALRRCNFQFEGIHHRGIDDAKMITKIFKYIRKNK